MNDTTITEAERCARWLEKCAEGYDPVGPEYQKAANELRRLERENDQLRDAVTIRQKLADERKEQIDAQSERLVAMTAQPEALAISDKERLEWFEDHTKVVLRIDQFRDLIHQAKVAIELQRELVRRGTQ